MASILEPSRQDNTEQQKSLLVLEAEKAEKIARSNFEVAPNIRSILRDEVDQPCFLSKSDGFRLFFFR